jgi:CspA family cold shock protein
MAGVQLTGKVKFFNALKRFGFIKCDDGRDMFFSANDLMGDVTRVACIGEQVLFDERQGPRGPIAVNVYNLSDPVAMADYQAHRESALNMAAQMAQAHARTKAFKEAQLKASREWREKHTQTK